MLNLLILIGVLFLTMIANILSGMYYKVNTEKISFSKKKLLVGIKKAIIIAFGIITLAVVAKVINLGDISANIIVTGGIIFYATKLGSNMKNILSNKPLEDINVKSEVSE